MQTCSPTTDTGYAWTVIHTMWKSAPYPLPLLDGSPDTHPPKQFLHKLLPGGRQTYAEYLRSDANMHPYAV